MSQLFRTAITLIIAAAAISACVPSKETTMTPDDCNTTPVPQEAQTKRGVTYTLFAPAEFCVERTPETVLLSPYPMFIQVTNNSGKPVTIVAADGAVAVTSVWDRDKSRLPFEFGEDVPLLDDPILSEAKIAPGEVWNSPQTVESFSILATDLLEGTRPDGSGLSIAQRALRPMALSTRFGFTFSDGSGFQAQEIRLKAEFKATIR
jgi:hypothetical protein